MRGTLLIAMREIRERRTVLAAALVASLLPLATPLLPGVAASAHREARDILAAALACGMGLVLSFLLGGTVVARDLSENRLSFDFARPVGTLSIWAGRMGAAVALALAVVALIAFPTVLARGVGPTLRGTAWVVPVVCLGGGLAFAVGLAHVVSVAFRSRSRWLAVDLVAAILVLSTSAYGLRRLQAAFVPQTMVAVALLAVVAVIPALWIASAFQLVRGRTDLVRGHRAQSIALWSMLGSVALGIVGFSLWFEAVDLDDLTFVQAEPAPTGSWVALSGHPRGRPELVARFLHDTTSGRAIEVARGRSFTLFSEDGRRALWLAQRSGQDPTMEASFLDLAAPAAAPRATTITLTLPQNLHVQPALSPSGRRLVIFNGQTLAVHGVEDGRILAAAAIRYPGLPHLAFLDEDHVRLYTPLDRLVVHDLDVERKSLSVWRGPEIGSSFLRCSPDHRRLLVAARQPGEALLLDGTDGRIVARLPVRAQERGARGYPPCGFLADGRIAAIGKDGEGRAMLSLFSTDGAPSSTFDLGPVRARDRFWIGAEPSPEQLLIGLYQEVRMGETVRDGRLMLVSLTTGLRRDVAGTSDAGGYAWDPQRFAAAPGSVSSRLVQRGGSVWLLDPEAAVLRPFLSTPDRLQ